MTRLAAWTPCLFGLLFGLVGCFPMRPGGDGIHRPLTGPQLPPPPPPRQELPAPPTSGAAVDPAPAADGAQTLILPMPRILPDSPLDIDEVLASVDQHFPLLLAAQQELAIAAGQRLIAEGAFDLNLKSRAGVQGGTFPSERFDLLFEQPTTLGGVNVFSGYRLGLGDFPVYYGDRQTADGGEFRGGFSIPFLKDSAIDRRRASLRQAAIQQNLADPVIQRARIDALRAAARAYWNWVASGQQVLIARALKRIAVERQTGFEEQFKRGQIPEFTVIDNRRALAEREGTLIAAERRFQQASFDLSLYLRDGEGNPDVPTAERLPRNFSDVQPPAPETERLATDIEFAYANRPEMTRFKLLKDRVAVDLQLAENQALPALNGSVFGAQDVGKGKTSTGAFALDRSNAEAWVSLEVPLQRREARGRILSAQANLTQLLAQERYARDQIAAEVQDAVSNLDRTYERLKRAREEESIAQRVAELERERFRRGQGNLFEVNLRELSAASAQAKVIDTLADYFRAIAEHRAALGVAVPR